MRTAIAILALTLASTAATATEENAKLGRYALTAYQCFAYASNADRKTETERFFNLGLDASRKFIEALRAEKITREELSKFVPMTILWSVQGPTTDFSAGRMFEAVTTYAYAEMAEHDASGMPLPTAKWIVDKELLKSIGEEKYRKSNCELIK
ncbi:hypothetical protein [Neorhizobium galegae]|uniref:Uncharacterized protein n=1 Tax=Neorhizobium galegae bv. orientalis str. HAMBI 540 TaxID=1028800 RepID=A0A068SP24_NEOGA|nr:hypothetical protein [Neorhizobium galegae]CDN46820.1 Hypothetical protein RG540_CH06300 [Neorhizobium galegae bv. orientalis str. HAMBI 540]